MLASSPSGATSRSASALSQVSGAADLPNSRRDTTEQAAYITSTSADLSEAETLGVSSPELSPIPAPIRAGLAPRTPRTASAAARNDDFYTASWGSPYDLSLVPAGRHSQSPPQHSLGALAAALDDIDDDSPQISFGLSHLIPSRLTVSNIEVTPTRPSTPSGWTPIQDTPRIPGVEIIDPESVKIPARGLFASLSKAQEQSKRSSLNSSGIEGFQDISTVRDHSRAYKGHRPHDKNRTLRQEDIVGPTTIATMDSSKYASSPARESISTPTKPQSNAQIATPKSSVSTPAREPLLAVDSTPSRSKPVIAAAPRVRKKLAYKGKICWVHLPLNSRDDGSVTPLTAQDIARKLLKLRQDGHDIDGFDHDIDQINPPDSATSQTCAVFPLPVAREQNDSTTRPTVFIPDIRQWQEYVRELKEAKLRALGVSLGDEAGDQPPPLSRVPSSQFSGLPFSPPLPPSSAGSHRMSIAGNIFPHGFVPGSSNHTSTRSIASPLSSLSNPRHSLHMHRQSMFISPPLSQHQAMSPHGLPSWSPQPFGFNTASVSVASPGLSSGAADLRSPISPFSSLMDAATGFQFPQRTELVAQLQNQKQQQMMRQSQILPVRPASTLAEVPESETEDDTATAQSRSAPPEMFNPRPGHRHNISEKLEANISQALNLGRSDKAPLQDVDEAPVTTNESTDKQQDIPEWRRAAPVLTESAQSETANTAEPLVQITENAFKQTPLEALAVKQDDTIEADSGEALDRSIAINPWEHDPTFQRSPSDNEKRPSLSQKHSSKFSLSGLNVAAKEFKFNPKANPAAVFNPSIFSSSSFGFNPESVQPFIPRSASAARAASPALSKSVNTPSKPKFNIDAPAFSPSGFGGNALSKSEFGFASAPILKPTAPAFEPGAPAIVSDGAFSASAGSESSRLFASVNLDDFAKHGKKSKAIPILSPRSDSHRPTELMEDEDGRLSQGFAKRTRTGADDGDDVPLFAAPGPEEPVAQSVVALHEPSGVIAQISTGQGAIDGLSDDTVSEVDAQEDSLFDILTGGDKVAAIEPDSSITLDFRGIPIQNTSSQGTEIVPSVARVIAPESGPSSPAEVLRASAAAQIDDSTQLSPTYLTDEDDDKLDDLSEALMSPPSSAAVSKPSAEADLDNSRRERLNSSSSLRKLPSSVRYYDELDQPTFQEIDAIMQQFNDGGSDFGIERDLPSWPDTSPGSLSTARPNFFADPSTQFHMPTAGSHLEVARNDVDSASVTQDPFSDARAVGGYESPTVHAHNDNRVNVSDWNEFSSGVEDRIRARGPFLDSRVSDLIASTLTKRLGPLEKQLQTLSSNMLNMTSRPGRRAQSRATLDSDADDEDYDSATGKHSRAWSRSPMRDRKAERMRAVIQEALLNHRPVDTTANLASSTILQALDEMRQAMTAEISKGVQQDHVTSAIEAALSQRDLQTSKHAAPQLDDIRAAVEAIVANHASVAEATRASQDEESNALSELLQKNIELTARSAEESEARKSAELRHNESARMLKLAEEELSLLRASIKDHELLHAAQDAKLKTVQQRAGELDAQNADVQHKIANLTETNAALKATLEEYRLSHDKWRTDLDSVNREKQKLAGISGVLKLQAEEAVRIRQSMGDRLEKLSTDATAATSKLLDERSKWQAADAEYRNRLSYWKDKAEAERVTRENFERKIEGIEALDRENMKLRHLLEHVKHEKDRLQTDNENLVAKDRESQRQIIAFEHLQTEHSKLGPVIEKLSQEKHEHEIAADKYARDWREARDNGQQEVQRVRILLQAEVDAANNHANIVRSGLEGEVARLQKELHDTKHGIEATRSKVEAQMEAEAALKRDAVREVAESKTAALSEQKQAYEERLEDLRRQHRRDLDHVIENKNQSETFLREAHAQRLMDLEQQQQRALEQAYEDKDRVETYLSERIAVADGKVELLEDKIAHLTSKVTTAQSAAQAAAQLAQSARSAQVNQSVVLPSAAGSLSGASSAALRESLQVLQEQLQERQLHIESLESQLEKVDETLPEQIRAREVEVSWLRELLGVRLDDLSELCDLLARDDFDREAVQNAAIRIKTGLKMNIQEREQQAAGNTPLAAGAANLAASIQSYATPKAAQLARVIGEWRATPSRRTSQSSSSFLTGLMTPPASNLRRTPEQPSTVELRRGSSASASSQLHVGQSAASAASTASSSRAHDKARASFPAPSLKEPAAEGLPCTPLLHAHAYDDDAETRYSTDGYYDDELSTVEGSPQRTRQRLEF